MTTTRTHLLPLFASALLALTGLASCGGDDASTDSNEAASNGAASNGKTDSASNGASSNGTAAQAGYCVGVRGNGQLIFEHFAALARIHEHYGTIEGIAGGSSASITSFLTESIYLNPHVSDCGGTACTPEESAARIALMYKSLLGYLVVLGNTDEALALQQLGPIVAQAKEMGIGELVAGGNIEEARTALTGLLGSDDLVSLINPEMLDLLSNSPDPSFHVQDVWEALSSFGSFAVDNDRIFLRPGLINFNAFAAMIGRIGNFYAGYGPADADAWEAFLSSCATPSRGMDWAKAAQIDAGGASCGEMYGSLLTKYREALLADEDGFASRIDDPIGMKLSAIISTSVLEGAAVTEFKQAREGYLTATEYSFDIDFNDVKFGYWGQESDLNTIASNAYNFSDTKTSKFLNLGGATWRKALSLSPAEPGLTRALEINDTQVSAGGWSDLAPTLVLKNMGCEKVILITRRGDVKGFGTDVAGLLGMDDAGYDALYDLKGTSSVRLSIEQADGRWCTDWNNIGGTDFAAAFADGYAAPMETTDARFTDGANPYANTSKDLGLPACSPGVGE